jgi:hypothetical protein
MAGPLGGRCRQRPPLRMKNTSMAGPLGVLPVGLAAATTKDEEDVHGGSPGGAADGSDSVHHRG